MKKRYKGKTFHTAFFLLILLCGALANPAHAKTRWSSVHLIPDADFLSGGQFVVDVEGYTFNDSLKGQIIRPTGLLNCGVIEWVNLEMGYAGGFTLGFKARLLGENGSYMPSLAIGARNIISGKEAHYFNSSDTMTNAFYFALAKSVDPIRLRIHGGMQSIPTSKTDQADIFFGLEEYFGSGLYATLEVERLKGAFWPSLFVSWRVLEKRLEFSAGAVAVNRLFFDQNNKFSVSLASADGFVRPGIWLGVRYKGFVRLGKNKVFSSVEDNVKTQGENIDLLKKQIDSLKTALSENLTRMAKVDNSIIMLSDSIYSDRNRLRAALFDKLIALKILYESEPFEPEQVKQAINRIISIKETALPIIKEFVVDKKQDRKIRMLGISLIGEMGGTGASDALLDVLSQSEDPDIKIEILIALGKIKESRALYVLEQLANDPIDVVAFTAQEVLLKLVKEKGIKLSEDFKMRPINMTAAPLIGEEKIPVPKTARIGGAKAKDTLEKPLDNTLSKKPLPGNVKDTQDVWSMHAPDAASSKMSPMKQDQINNFKSDTTRSPVDTTARASLKPDPITPGDSTAAKTPQAKKDKKDQTASDKKKEKASSKKKKVASTPGPEDKNW
jgi:hypothetical protein